MKVDFIGEVRQINGAYILIKIFLVLYPQF